MTEQEQRNRRPRAEYQAVFHDGLMDGRLACPNDDREDLLHPVGAVRTLRPRQEYGPAVGVLLECELCGELIELQVGNYKGFLGMNLVAARDRTPDSEPWPSVRNLRR